MESKKVYNHILWDWNGTLLNDLEVCIKSINKSLSEHNLPVVTKEKYLELFCFPVENYYKKLGFDFSKTSYKELAIKFINDYIEESKDTVTLQEGAVEMLRFFHSKGLKQSILSASEKEILLERLQHFKIKKYFCDVLALDNIYAESKVDLGRNWLNGNKDKQVVLIGDTTHDYKVAKEMGIDCILFTGGHGREQSFKDIKVPVIHNLQQLKDYII